MGGDLKKNGDLKDHISAEISKNISKIPGDLWRPAITTAKTTT